MAKPLPNTVTYRCTYAAIDRADPKRPRLVICRDEVTTGKDDVLAALQLCQPCAARRREIGMAEKRRAEREEAARVP